MLVILAAGVAPGLALLSYFYLKDQYNSEPLALVFKMFLSGIIVVFPIMFAQYVMDSEGIIVSALMSAFIEKGLLEEFFKWFLFLYMIFPHVEFDEPYDGIVYGVAISLGFATFENILYLLANGVGFAWGRALFPVSSHALFGVIMGYYMGRAKFNHSKKRKYVMIALFFPVLLHGSFDYILLTQERWFVYMLPFMLFLWWFGLRKVKTARILTQKLNESF